MKMQSVLLLVTVVMVSVGATVGQVSNPADINNDDRVDFLDFAIVADNWLWTAPDIVLIPGGEFLMGDHFNEGWGDALPVHLVKVDSFYMSACETTNRQYCDYLNSAKSAGRIKVVGGIVYASGDTANSSPYCDTNSYSSYSQIDYSVGVFSVRKKAGRDMSNHPVVRVTWYGAAAYCNWRSRQDGYQACYNLSTWQCDFFKNGYRLPTEAEWEYAARGGLSDRRFPWGDTISHSQANYYSKTSTSYDVSPTKGYHPAYNDGVEPYTAPVGSFQANGYGLYDMAGNVWEWCNDWYTHNYYSSSPYDNPTGPSSSDSYRVLRGGAWYYPPYYCSVANRYYYDSHDYRYYDSGFRVALNILSEQTVVGWWTMDDNAADTTVIDKIGANHGTARRNTQEMHTSGKINGALNFNGSSDYVDCGNDLSFDVTDGLTLSAWIKLDSLDRINAIIQKREGGTGNPSFYFRVYTSNRLAFAFHDGTSGVRSVGGGTQLSLGVWYHVVAAYDGQYMRLYLDDEIDGTRTETSTIAVGTHSLIIGKEGSSCFSGSIDHVKLFNYGLSEEEIEALYDEGGR